MPSKIITKEQEQMIIRLKKRGYSDGDTYIQYIRSLIDDKLPIEKAIKYETMRDVIRRSKNYIRPDRRKNV